MKSLFPVSSKGFTLVEMAIVLVIIGIVMALGLPLLTQLSKNVKYGDSRDIVKGAVDSVTSWAAGKNRLPDLASGAGTATDFSSVVKSPSDAFAQPLVYVYDHNSATTTNICGISTTAITLSYSVGSQTYTVPNVAFLVFSLSDNNKVDTKVTAVSPSTLNGTSYAAATIIPTTINTGEANPGGAASGAANTVTITADTFNDIVQWVTIDELRTKINCQGSELTIVNNELPYGYNNTPYTANIYANGGVPNTVANAGKYTWCVQQSSSGNSFAGMSYSSVIGTTVSAGNIYINANCQGAPSLWSQADYIQISGTPILVVSSSGTYYISTQSNNVGNTPGGAANVWQSVSFTPASNAPWNAALYYPTGSNTLTIYVSDNGNNTASKTFTFTVNPL